MRKEALPIKKNTKQDQNSTRRKIRPALTPEAREQQMIALAVDRAEQQLLDGTASAQVITHYLKLASSNNDLEKQAMQKQIDLMQAKIDALQRAETTEQLFQDAIAAMKSYGGHDD